MRILHTADRHLGGRADRTDDLRRAVERVAAYRHSERADALLAAAGHGRRMNYGCRTKPLPECRVRR